MAQCGETEARAVAFGRINRLLCVHLYNVVVEKRVRKFSSFEQAEEAEIRDDMAMTPQERLEVVIELMNRNLPDGAQQRLARVFKIIKHERS
jgi:hypothetical protein